MADNPDETEAETVDFSSISTDSLTPLETELIESVRALTEQCRQQSQQLETLTKRVESLESELQYFTDLLDQNEGQ